MRCQKRISVVNPIFETEEIDLFYNKTGACVPACSSLPPIKNVFRALNWNEIVGKLVLLRSILVWEK